MLLKPAFKLLTRRQRRPALLAAQQKHAHISSLGARATSPQARSHIPWHSETSIWHTLRDTIPAASAQTAATALHMGMSVFKKVARSVGISRWPFRKRQSVREIMEMIDKHLVR